MKLFQAWPPDPATHVFSTVPDFFYRCTTLAELDEHLVEVCRNLGPGSNLSDAAKVNARLDLDRLLERRVWLRLVADVRPQPGDRRMIL